MLRLVLLVLYLLASSSISSEKQGGSLDPLGLNSSLLTIDAGGGYDPNGAAPPPPSEPTPDAGAGYDPDGYQ